MNSKDSLTFGEHLEELRKRLFVAVLAVVATAIVAYVYSEPILSFLTTPIRSYVQEFYFFEPADAFLIRVKVAILAGVLLASPVVLWQVWGFLSPGMHAREKKAVLPAALATSVCFLGGAAFCFFLVIPWALRFFMGFETEYLRAMISMKSYIDFVSMMVLVFGVAFNLPVFMVLLAALGIVGARTFHAWQKPAIFLIFVAAAVLTPGPDVASQLLLAAPLVVLFEIGVLGAKIVEVIRKK